jgi:hypothetical protein
MPIGIASSNIKQYFIKAKVLKKDLESILILAQS